MDYNFAIKKCTEALVRLTSEDNIQTRVENGFKEISSLDKEDVIVEDLKAVVEWCEEYLLISELNIKVDGMVEAISDRNREYGKLAHQLTYLCVKIIENVCLEIKKEDK